jgi:dihydrofolate synthase/folylpolyglutamate synthase
VDNAGLAIACSEHLEGLIPDDGALRDGLARVDWPARLQRLKWGPLIDRLPVGVEDDWELWLDGGHNAAAGAALAETLSGWSPRPLHLIYGMMNTKAAEDFLRPLGALASSLSAVAIPGEANSLTAEAAAARAGRAGFSAQGWASLEVALEAIAEDQAPGRILICGSLYLAGRVLAAHG